VPVDAYPALRAGLHSIVPAGLSLQMGFSQRHGKPLINIALVVARLNILDEPVSYLRKDRARANAKEPIRLDTCPAGYFES
jgi:hypothetical protein